MSEQSIADITIACRALDAEVTRLTVALEMIAGRRPPIDYLMGNADIAMAALDKKAPFTVRILGAQTSYNEQSVEGK